MNSYMRKIQTRDMIQKFQKTISGINKFAIENDIIENLYRIQLLIIYLIISVAYLKLFSIIISPGDNFDLLFKYIEKAVIILATIVILTFTYSLTLDYPKNKYVKKGGKYFLKSFLNFIISIIILIGFKDALFNPSNVFNLPDIIFSFSTLVIFICYLSGVVMLISSALFFAYGINKLLRSL